MSGNRPLAFVDLDDTLFQTARKMAEGVPRTAATLDVHGQPNGFMDPVQHAFITWLLATADVVPVTARSVEAYGRVMLPFAEGAICSHGGVMLRPDGLLDRSWHERMIEVLQSVQERLPALCEATLAIGRDLGYSLRGWVVEEEGLCHYVVIKHNESDDAVLAEVLAGVRSRRMVDACTFMPTATTSPSCPRGWPSARPFRSGCAATVRSTASDRSWASATASPISGTWTSATCGGHRRAASLPIG
ncbi:HAD family hydrolase [Burkholderia contaminans]|uniref:trehalose phosphatase n=1 Tax=Burkholderia contaminans TaxID=488447 RepID=UPI002D81098C|nr:trehalose phosphatase [Burkholderia contaminans]